MLSHARPDTAPHKVFDLEHLTRVGIRIPPNRGLSDAVNIVCNNGPELLTRLTYDPMSICAERTGPC
jgi:hypothetical protein